jgi:hypothetical protein
MVWGRVSAGAVTYIMDRAPAPTDSFSEDFFEAVPLHNAVMLNAKLIQEMPFGFQLTASLENILNDYGIDPLNPAPARSITLGVEYHIGSD